MKIKRFNEKITYYDVVTKLQSIIYNDLSFVNDVCDIELTPYDDGTLLSITPKGDDVYIKDIIYDIIPFYENLLKDFRVGYINYNGRKNMFNYFINIQFFSKSGQRKIARFSENDILDEEQLNCYLNINDKLAKVSIFLDYDWEEEDSNPFRGII